MRRARLVFLSLFAGVGAVTILVLSLTTPAMLLGPAAVQSVRAADAAKTETPASAAKDKAAPAANAQKKRTAAEIMAEDDDENEPADNSFCLVCHLNFEKEKLTRVHQPIGVGCAKCHGESEKHSGDEDGLTAPDVLFAKEDVDKYCMTCHPKEKIAKDKNHKDAFDAKIPADEHLVCTECHAENHKMAVRTRKWDKKTRKLISDDGVRMMYKNSPATEGVPDTGKKKPAK